MNVLIYPTCYVTPHLETELEIAQNHLNNGDTVYFLVCNSNLRTCLVNPEHVKSLCVQCNSTVKNGIGLLRGKNVIKLDYPKIDLDYSEIPKEFNDIEELKRFKIDETIELGLSAASSLISINNKEHKFDTKAFSDKVYRELCSGYYLYKIFVSFLIPNYKPGAVYIFNGRLSTSWPIVSLCKKLNQPFFVHDRGGVIGRYITVEDTIPHDLDGYVKKDMAKLLLTKDPFNKDIGAQFFIDRRNRIEQGWHSFTVNQERDNLPKSFSKKRKNISIFNSAIEEYAAVKGWEKFIFIFESEIEVITAILDAFKDDQTKQFYVRVHPSLKGYINTQTNDLRNLSIRYRNVEIILPESEIDTYAMVDNSDTVIVMGSTVGVEAVYWGKPVVQLGLSPYNHLDTVYIPESSGQLIEMINCDLKPKDTLGAIKYGYWESSRGIPYKYFHQQGIFKGKFFNKRIHYSRIKYFFYRFLEIKSLSEIKRFLLRLLFNR